MKRNREKIALNLSDSTGLSDHIGQIKGYQTYLRIEKKRLLKIKLGENLLFMKA